MAPPTIPSAIPDEIFAGDTLYFNVENSDYPASSGWTLYYVLVKSGTRITFNSTASGDDHLFNVAKATTAAWTAGEYDWQSYFGDGTERYTYQTGQIKIKADFSAQSSGYDARSTAKKVIDALESVLGGDTSATNLMIISQSCGDLNVTRKSDIYEELQKWKRIYKAECDAVKLAAGETIEENSCYVRFKKQ